MQIEEFLEKSCERSPDKIALICGEQRLSYMQIESRCNQLAHALIESGLERWDRVAVFAPNAVETAIAVFATLKAGGVFVLINPTTKRDKLAFILNNCRAKVLITLPQCLPVSLDASIECPWLRSVLVAGVGHEHLPTLSHVSCQPIEVIDGQSTERCPRRNIDVDLAALIYTSGSTGRPKGVMMTHLNVVSAATSITTYLENTADDIILDVLPLSFDYGLYQLLMAFKVGGTLVLENSFTYPYVILETLARERVTGFPIVPTICSILLQLKLENYSFPHLRYITNTAAALPVAHIFKLRELFPKVKIYSMYGLTECKRVSYLPPDQIDVRAGSVGRGMPNEEVYLVDNEGNRLPPGSTGELVIRGSNVMKGYWEMPEETQKVLRPGCFDDEKILYSGDLFRTDDEGYLYFIGRKDDIIKTRGEKVSPREIEDVLHSHPGVAEAAVVGIPNDVLGNAICAFVKLKSNATLDERELKGFCADRLEDFMIPSVIHFRDFLPKSANGKIAKRDLLAEEMGVQIGVAS